MSQQERKYLHIQSRTDTKEEWYNINPKLLEREIGYEKNTGQYKIGDGETLWRDLPYAHNIENGEGQFSLQQLSSQAKGAYSHSEGYQTMAISKYSSAKGKNTIAGCKGYWYSSVDSITVDNKVHSRIKLTTLHDETMTEIWSDSDICEYRPGDVISIVADSKYYNCATIKSVEKNVIILNENLDEVLFGNKDYSYDSGFDGNVVYVIARPDVGNVDIAIAAIAEGGNSSSSDTTGAYGPFSHVEGRNNQAIGHYSHAEGRNNKASNVCAHVEGQNNKASGELSHAEGAYTEAIGNKSHAEGNSTIASGATSHAEGNDTEASGTGSHAEGWLTVASGEYSHSEGLQTTASGDYSHVQGKYNIEDKENKYAHIVGNGKKNGNKITLSNAHTLDWDGKAWYAGNITIGVDKNKVLTEVDINIENGDGENSVQQKIDATDWSPSNPYVQTTISEGTTTKDGNIIATDESGTKILVGSYGKNSTMFNSKSQTVGEKSHAEGSKNIAFENNSHAEGNETFAAGKHSHSEGNTSTALGEASHAEGTGSVAEGKSAHAEGEATQALNKGSHAEGYQTTVTGSYGHGEGYSQNLANNYVYNEDYSFKTDDEIINAWHENKFGIVKGAYSHAEGMNNLTLNAASHAEGVNTIASGNGAHAEGENTLAKGTSSHAEGAVTMSFGNYSHAEGYDTEASGNSSHAEGNETFAAGFSSHTEGSQTTAFGDYSHAEGKHTIAKGNIQHVQGKYNLVDNNNKFATIVGNGIKDDVNEKFESYQTSVTKIPAGGSQFANFQPWNAGEYLKNNQDNTIPSRILHFGFTVDNHTSSNASRLAYRYKVLEDNGSIEKNTFLIYFSNNKVSSYTSSGTTYINNLSTPYTIDIFMDTKTQYGNIYVNNQKLYENKHKLCDSESDIIQWQKVLIFSHSNVNYDTDSYDLSMMNSSLYNNVSLEEVINTYITTPMIITENTVTIPQAMLNLSNNAEEGYFYKQLTNIYSPTGIGATITNTTKEYTRIEYHRANAHTLDWEGNAWYAGNILSQASDSNLNCALPAPLYVGTFHMDWNAIDILGDEEGSKWPEITLSFYDQLSKETVTKTGTIQQIFNPELYDIIIGWDDNSIINYFESIAEAGIQIMPNGKVFIYDTQVEDMSFWEQKLGINVIVYYTGGGIINVSYE